MLRAVSKFCTMRGMAEVDDACMCCISLYVI